VCMTSDGKCLKTAPVCNGGTDANTAATAKTAFAARGVSGR
jgi:hypothetical protein